MPTAPLRATLAVLAGALGAGLASPALAGKHDLNLLKLCEQRTPGIGFLNGQVAECSWVQRARGGTIQQVVMPAEVEAQYRSLMSELGTVLAPRLVIPADTLGFSGFQVSAELGITKIHAEERYWNAVEGVSAENTAVGRPSGWLSTVGAFVRKGIWLGLPAFEAGGGVVNVLESRLLAWQGYLRVALHEGFHTLPLPSVSVRLGGSYLSGTDQVEMTVTSLDIVVSKGFGILGTARLEPFLGYSLLRIAAKGGRIDATPSCDAYRVQTAGAGQPLGDYCGEGQRGTVNDTLAYFTFPEQDPIRRQRFVGGLKIKFATVFLTAEYDLIPGGDSRDEKRPNGARDGSGRQDSFSLSGGFDF